METILALVAMGGAMALSTSLRIMREYERAVVFRLGRVRPIRGPGLIFLVPFGIEVKKRVSLRIVALDIPPQDVITRDNVSVKVNAVLYFRVSDPLKAILEIEDYRFATSQLAQTTLRSVIGQAELDELLAEREKFNEILREIIDESTDAWGIRVTAVEVKDVDLPQEMRRAIARQAEAERERRAKVINALGELQAAGDLRDAARLLSSQPASLQLRFLLTASEIAAEKNSTILLPLPINLFTPKGRLLEEAVSPDTEALSEAEEKTRELTEAKSLRAGENHRAGEGDARRTLESGVSVEESVDRLDASPTT
jgi:regulator of protease activity HflC (stomatin/prohibitin superfamily)